MTALVLVTHPGIGPSLLIQARVILGQELTGVSCIELASGSSAGEQELATAMQQATAAGGVLVLTDLPGATPSNLSVRHRPDCCRVVSGLNLPMLIRAWTYRSRPPEELARLVIDGARGAIVELQ